MGPLDGPIGAEIDEEGGLPVGAALGIGGAEGGIEAGGIEGVSGGAGIPLGIGLPTCTNFAVGFSSINC